MEFELLETEGNTDTCSSGRNGIQPPTIYLCILKRADAVKSRASCEASWILGCLVELDAWQKVLRYCTISGNKYQIGLTSVHYVVSGHGQRPHFQTIRLNSRKSSTLFLMRTDYFSTIFQIHVRLLGS